MKDSKSNFNWKRILLYQVVFVVVVLAALMLLSDMSLNLPFLYALH